MSADHLLAANASPRLKVMAAAAHLGGLEAKRCLGRLAVADMTLKAARDYQTEADIGVERLIAGHLTAAFPDWGISGEEMAADREAGAGKPLFVIDPIDGTTNFAWGIPHFGHVVTLVEEGVVTAGVVYDAMQDEMFSTERGQGAYLNGRRLAVRDGDDVVNAVMGASLPVPGQVKSVPVDTYHAALRRLMDNVAGLRRFGSAALSIAYVAAGRLDGFFEDGLSLNDYGASKLVVEEAGGLVTDFAGQPVPLAGRSAILAAAPSYHRWLLEGFR
jgi:myo-inositol-1(or 4)-monophosphatase